MKYCRFQFNGQVHYGLVESVGGRNAIVRIFLSAPEEADGDMESLRTRRIEAIPLEEALVVDSAHDPDTIHAAFEAGTPVVVRATSPADVRAALARPEVAVVLVPEGRQDLLDLDLTELTYG